REGDAGPEVQRPDLPDRRRHERGDRLQPRGTPANPRGREPPGGSPLPRQSQGDPLAQPLSVVPPCPRSFLQPPCCPPRAGSPELRRGGDDDRDERTAAPTP